MFDRAGHDHHHEDGPLSIGSLSFRSLHVCRRCMSPLVQLVEHEDAGQGHWHLTLHCPECDTYTSGAVSDERCAELDEELERGTHALLDALLGLQREQNEAEVAAFAAALAADVLRPEDF